MSSMSPSGLVHARRLPRLWLTIVAILTLGFASLGTLPVSAQDSPSTGIQLSVADVAERANPAVVTIYTYTNASGTNGLMPGQSQMPSLPGQEQAPNMPQQGNGQTGESNEGQQQALGAGSGWIFDEEGHVVTNAHVVEGADNFTVAFQDGTEVEATLVGKDTFQDVAVLQLQLADGQQVPGVATVGDSSAMRAGDEVVAFGTPLGEFANSVSDGIIGGLNRTLDTGEGYGLGNLIQHDADLSSGNSGGPLLNMQGEVIGMNVASISNQNFLGSSTVSSGLNFAIDGNTVVNIVNRIIDGGGDIVQPYLGIQGQETADGQLVVAVEPGSPADQAGLQADDVIVAVDGEQLSADLPLMNALFKHEPGDQVTLAVQRGGSTETLTVTLVERPANV